MTICSAGKHALWLWMLISTLHLAAAQDGYVSVDCGASHNSTDSVTGIEWTTDELYINTGINQILDSAVTNDVNEQQLQTLRYFPANRSKHCYSLPAAGRSSFLIRATFLHGGFQPSVDNSFSISIDSTEVDDLTWSPADVNFVAVFEYVINATSDSINFCLLPKGSDAFINTLELRPLAGGMYSTGGNYLKLLTRLNCGAGPTDPVIRYPDDPYDRIWFSPGKNFKITTTKTTSIVPVPVEIFDKVPPRVMQTAWVASELFWWNFSPSAYELERTTTFYVNHFIAEIATIGPLDTRIMHIDLNGQSYFSSLNVTSSTTQIYSKGLTITTTANFTFSAAPGSTLGPILNAGEIYASREMVISSTDVGDVNALEVVKSSLGLSSWTGDPCLPVAYNWLTCDKGATPRVITVKLSNFNLTGTIPASIAELTALTDLWLDNNRIKGPIPDLTKLTNLRTLHLQNNSMSGGIPSTLASLPVLTELFLSNNKFSGPIPGALANRNGLNLETSGNANLCAPTENCPVLPVDWTDNSSTGGGGGGGGGGSSGAIIGGIIGGVVAVIVIIGLIVWCYCRKGPKSSRNAAPPVMNTDTNQTGASNVSNGSKASSNRSAPGGGAVVKQARAFTLHEVQVATHQYKTKIGEGGFGPVYYGRLPSGFEVAVKVNSETSSQGKTEFTNEVAFLSRVHHKNLVSLVGYCEEDGQQILIYEFMSKGTLREHLYGKDMKGKISWKERLDIAVNAAKGLEYLHNDCIPKIIHRDIKSNNILLNDKLLAKVADFGISKLAPDEDQTGGVSTIVRGTTGYLDPEYYAQNRLTQKSDVYSFGVVLLEIICGRPPNNPSYGDAIEHNLVEWARRQLNGNDLESIVDPTIRGTYKLEAMWKVAELAMGCVEPHGTNRPDMSGVVRGLTVAAELEEQKTQTYVSEGKQAGRGDYGTPGSEYPSTFNTESSYPSTEFSGASTHEYSPSLNGGNGSARPPLFTPQGTFARLPSDTRNTDSSWLAPKPR